MFPVSFPRRAFFLLAWLLVMPLARAQDSPVREELPGGFVVSPGSPSEVHDPRYGWRFARAVIVYGPPFDDEGSGLRRRVIIHHQPDDALWARRTARLCARLLRLHRERFERDAAFPRGSREADVWLAPQTPPGRASLGGETRDNQVYVFDTATPRTPIEWVRTVAHEWGHLTLPAARGFTEPEGDAAGFLGERLYLKWLREEMRGRGGSVDDGTEAAGLDLYHARQIAPLIARFQATGPNGREWEARNTRGMDLYIGAALATDDALGSALLARGLFSIPGVRARDLLEALDGAVAETRALPIRLPAWVPLRRATYEIAASADGSVTDGSVAVADRPPLTLPRRGAARLSVRFAGWKWVRAAKGNVGEIVLRSLRPDRAALR